MLCSTFPSLPRDSRGYQELHLCATAQLKTTQPVSLGARRVLRKSKGKKDESTSRVQRGERVLVQLKASTYRDTIALASPGAYHHSTSHPPPGSPAFAGYIFKSTLLIQESYRGLGTSQSTVTNPLTSISRIISRKDLWESETALQLRHVTGRQIKMFSNTGSQLTVPVYVLHSYCASHTIICLSQADRRTQTIPRRAMEKYLWISGSP